MFETIFELPSQVRSSLDEEDQEVFRKTYNDLAPKTEAEVQEAMKKAWRACKDLPSSFSFNIIASVEDVDKDRDVIDMDSIKEHMDSFLKYGGNIQDDHSSYQLGLAWDWEPIEKDGKPGISVWGNLFGGDEVYDNARKAFVKGTNNLSIAGEASRGKFQCDDKGCYTRRDVKQLMEISLCKVPANRHCTLQWYNEKAKFTKSVSDSLRLNVDEYTIHKDYTTCPIQMLKHSLKAIGYDAHARPEGVFVAMDREEFDRTVPIAKSKGVAMSWVDGGAMFVDRDSMIEKSFKGGFESGMINSDGALTDYMDKDTFSKLYSYGLLNKRDDIWWLDGPGREL